MTIYGILDEQGFAAGYRYKGDLLCLGVSNPHRVEHQMMVLDNLRNDFRRRKVIERWDRIGWPDGSGPRVNNES